MTQIVEAYIFQPSSDTRAKLRDSPIGALLDSRAAKKHTGRLSEAGVLMPRAPFAQEDFSGSGFLLFARYKV